MGTEPSKDHGTLTPELSERLLGMANGVMWAADRSLAVTFSTGAALRALGLRPGQSVGVGVADLFPRSTESTLAVAAHQQALGGMASDYVLTSEGRTFAVRVEPLRDGSGAIVGVAGVAWDQTDLRLMERGLHERDEELRDARRQELLLRNSQAVLRDLGMQIDNAAVRLHRLTAHLQGHLQAQPEARALADAVTQALEKASIASAQMMGLGSPAGRDDRGGTETILVVDDEPTVRGFVRSALEHLGYQVLDSDDSEKALSLGESFGGAIHLLLTDVVLPGMNGPQLAARLAPVRPEMRILYMTGYADAAVVDRSVVSAGQPLLLKPFTTAGLALEVRRALRN